jgi:hypothetical protein
MGNVFSFEYGDGAMKASFEKVYDADGGVWMRAVPHGDLTAKTPYKVIVNEYGPVTAALADDTTYYYVGVPIEAVDASEVDWCWMKIGGYIEDMVTPSLSVAVGHALSLDGGAVADAGADYTGAAGEFAVCTEASTASETQCAILVPERILSTS